jgi:transposase
MDLTDEQSHLIELLIPTPPRRVDDTRCNPRNVMNSAQGAAWANIPSQYQSGSTCYRYFQAWVNAGVFVKLLSTLVNGRGQIDLAGSCRRERGKGSKIMAVLGLSSAMNPGLLSPRLLVADEPERLIDDRAYDS